MAVQLLIHNQLSGACTSCTRVCKRNRSRDVSTAAAECKLRCCLHLGFWKAYAQGAIELIDDLTIWNRFPTLILVDDRDLFVDPRGQSMLAQLLRKPGLLQCQLELVRDAGMLESITMLIELCCSGHHLG